MRQGCTTVGAFVCSPGWKEEEEAGTQHPSVDSKSSGSVHNKHLTGW
jgi:hypothetical protein